VLITALLEQPGGVPAAPAQLPMLIPGGELGTRGVPSSSGLPQTIVSTGTRTRIAVSPGEWVVIASGGSAGGAEAVDPFGALDTQAGSSDSLFLLRVDRAD
jgi:sarcosine oxidase gamma subunit